jgi:hypothetical protein
MMQFLKETVPVDYEADLASAIEFMEHNIENKVLAKELGKNTIAT